MERNHSTRRWLVGVEATTGALAAAGGLLLVLRPDGSLLGANKEALAGSPFSSWLVPGLLLLTLVGCGFLGTAFYVHAAGRHAPTLSVLAGAGLVLFEAFEVAWLGPQALEFAYMAVGLAVVVLGLRLARPQRTWRHRAMSHGDTAR